ncbi:MAG: tetratricopeptide repeat protein [Cyanobacteria bacterium SZAS-4]|nr:tetratricopeptide repeat protein [Cyanobacteria bacterium SZAS-4]
MKTIKQSFKRWFFYPLMWVVVTIVGLLAQQYFVAALCCSVAICMLIVNTIPSIVLELAQQEILAGHFSQGEKLARFGMEWCKIFFIGPTRRLPRSISYDQLFKDNLSAALMITGKFSDAIAVDKEILAELEKQGDTAGAANARNSLALCYLWLGDLKESERLIDSAIVILENLERNAVKAGESIKDVHTSRLAYALHVKATLLEKTRNYAAAEVVAQKAIDTFKKLYDENSFEMTSHFVLHGSILLRLNRFDGAESNLQKAFRIRHMLLPPEHPLLSSVDKEVGRLYTETGRLALAEPLLRSALQSLLALANGEHPDLPEYKGDLARLLVKRKNFVEAEKLLTEALEQRERQSTANHPDLIDFLLSLSEIASANGDSSKATSLTARAGTILALLRA